MFRAFLALSLLMFPLFAFAQPSAPPEFPRMSVAKSIAFRSCGTTSQRVTLALDPALTCPEGDELAGALMGLDVVVKTAAELQGISPELFSGATVVFVPFVLTNCSTDPADTRDYAGCTEVETKFSVVSLLTGDPADVAIHELEHTAIYLREKDKLFYSKKRENKHHEKLDADRMKRLMNGE